MEVSASHNYSMFDIQMIEDHIIDLNDLDQPLVIDIETLYGNIDSEKVHNTVHNGYDSDIANIEKQLKVTITRIKRRIIHIIAFRQMQLQNNLVSISGTYNKYNTSPKQLAPHISCRNMLKLIRWCRYFDRTVVPHVQPTRLICKPDSLSCIPMPTKVQIELSRQRKSCYICQTTDYIVEEDRTSFCQLCLYRKHKFLYGSMLECHKCKVQLQQSNFEWWNGQTWCNSCLWHHGLDVGIVKYEKIVEIE